MSIPWAFRKALCHRSLSFHPYPPLLAILHLIAKTETIAFLSLVSLSLQSEIPLRLSDDLSAHRRGKEREREREGASKESRERDARVGTGKRERSDKDGTSSRKRRAGGAAGEESRRRSRGGHKHGAGARSGAGSGDKSLRSHADGASPEHSPAKKGADRTILQVSMNF